MRTGTGVVTNATKRAIENGAWNVAGNPGKQQIVLAARGNRGRAARGASVQGRCATSGWGWSGVSRGDRSLDGLGRAGGRSLSGCARRRTVGGRSLWAQAAAAAAAARSQQLTAVHSSSQHAVVGVQQQHGPLAVRRAVLGDRAKQQLLHDALVVRCVWGRSTGAGQQGEGCTGAGSRVRVGSRQQGRPSAGSCSAALRSHASRGMLLRRGQRPRQRPPLPGARAPATTSGSAPSSSAFLHTALPMCLCLGRRGAVARGWVSRAGRRQQRHLRKHHSTPSPLLLLLLLLLGAAAPPHMLSLTRCSQQTSSRPMHLACSRK